MSTLNINNKHISTLKEKLTQDQHLINPCLQVRVWDLVF